MVTRSRLARYSEGRLKKASTACQHKSYTYITDLGAYVCDLCGAKLSSKKIMMKERAWASVARIFAGLQGLDITQL
jgi:hypothetical protein